eukprot:TRINITY_DN62991_c0_g1_i1.p1 TRINITY_DN62991_c0_g1~~TRINITY_DN62991_c0_g1_i1.p1  ORF type:complete len:473 (+),score=85.01 TRINITY_DN62991_c0_g1_i1:199-1617(+)
MIPLHGDHSSSPHHDRRAGLRRLMAAVRNHEVVLPVERRRSLLVAAVFLDLMAAALVVPLLPIRLRALGVSQRMNGLIGSMFSLSQIIGGLLLGAMSDRYFGRRGLLLLSFGGAAVSYAIVGLPGVSLRLLVLSRIVVGLVKQSLTASTAMMTELTSAGAERTFWIGRLSGVISMAWITGQGLGGILNRYGASAPAVLAVAIYGADACLVRLAFPASLASREDGRSSPEVRDSAPKSSGSLRMFTSLASPTLARVVAVNLAMQFVMRASSTTRLLYELERWALTPADVGMLASYRSLLTVIAGWKVVGAFTQRFNSQLLLQGSVLSSLVCYLLEAIPGSLLKEFCGDLWPLMESVLPEKFAGDPSLLMFTLVCLPVNTAAMQIGFVAVKSRFTEVVPKEGTASALAALDVLQSVVGVIAPLTSGFIFDDLPSTSVPLRYAGLESLVLLTACLMFPAAQAEDLDVATARHKSS